MREKYIKIYGELKSGEKDKRLEELKNKINEKTATQQEYKEAKRIEKAKENLEKVESVMKLQRKVNAEILKVEGTINRINTNNKFSEQLDKTLIDLEEELKKIEDERRRNQEELKTATEENKATLTAKIEEANREIEENNFKYQKAVQSKLNIENTKNVELGQYGKMTIEELNEKQNDLKNKSARCDLVIVNLLKGRNLDDISVQLDNYQNRTFKCDEKLSNRRKTIKKDKVKDTELEMSDEKLAEIEKGLERETRKIENEVRKETALTTESEFAKKHPRLAKIGNWFKNIFSKKAKSEQAVENVQEKETKIERRTKGEKETRVEKDANKDKVIEDIINSNENDFKKYLKDITKNGYDKTIEEKAMENIVRRQEKLKQAKEQAYDREVAKLGKDYAEKSYHKDEELEK